MTQPRTHTCHKQNIQLINATLTGHSLTHIPAEYNYIEDEALNMSANVCVCVFVTLHTEGGVVFGQMVQGLTVVSRGGHRLAVQH